jgi:hypothetical protein
MFLPPIPNAIMGTTALKIAGDVALWSKEKLA